MIMLYMQKLVCHFLPNWRPNSIMKFSSSKKSGGGIYKDSIHEPDYLSWLFGRINNIEEFI